MVIQGSGSGLSASELIYLMQNQDKAQELEDRITARIAEAKKAEAKALQSGQDSLKGVNEAQKALAKAKVDADVREKAFAKRESDVKAREDKVSERETKVSARESELTRGETVVAQLKDELGKKSKEWDKKNEDATKARIAAENLRSEAEDIRAQADKTLVEVNGEKERVVGILDQLVKKG